jgi:hypothetical protein
MIHRHILRLPTRVATLQAAEFPDRIVLKLQFQPAGFSHAPEVAAWLGTILQAYQGDTRPIFMGDPISGEGHLPVYEDVGWRAEINYNDE